MRYYNTHIKMSKITKTDHNRSWQGCGFTGILVHCCWKCKITQYLVKQFGNILRRYIYNYHMTQSQLHHFLVDLTRVSNWPTFAIIITNNKISCPIPEAHPGCGTHITQYRSLYIQVGKGKKVSSRKHYDWKGGPSQFEINIP